MRDTTTEKYLTGDFLAKFRGKLTGKQLKSGQSFTVVPYHGELSDAEVVQGLHPDSFAQVPLIELEDLKDVVIHFKNPADPRHPHFKEDLREVVLTGFSLEQVMRDGDTMHGMIRGKLFAPLYRGLSVPTPKHVEAWRKAETEMAKRFNLSLEKLNPAPPQPQIGPEAPSSDFGQTTVEPVVEQPIAQTLVPEPALILELPSGNASPKAHKEASEKLLTEDLAVTHTGTGLILTILVLFSGLMVFGFWAANNPSSILVFGLIFGGCFGLQFIRPFRRIFRIAWAIAVFAAFFVLLIEALGAA